MERKPFIVALAELIAAYWPGSGSRRGWIRRIAGLMGQIGLTLVVVVGVLWAQTAGAVPLGLSTAATSATAGTIAYQGRLADANGAPITNTVNMIFRLYNQATGGAPLWEEQWTGSNAVQVSDGLFNVMLGSLTPIPQSVITGNGSLFLGITVGTDDEMSPRVQLGNVPWAVQALTVPDGSITTEKIADGAVTGDKLNGLFLQLLGYKSCEGCGMPTESAGPGWVPVKGANLQDIVEVTTTTAGKPVLVQMNSRYHMNPARTPWCGIEVLAGNSRVRFAHIDGDNNPSADLGCSGSYLFTDLPAGTYTFRAEAWVNPAATVQWVHERQIVVYELTGGNAQ